MDRIFTEAEAPHDFFIILAPELDYRIHIGCLLQRQLEQLLLWTDRVIDNSYTLSCAPIYSLVSIVRLKSVQ